MHDLRERWNRLWDGLGAVGEAGDVFDALAAAYESPERAYHNLHHIEACLDELERAQYLAQKPLDLELAIWFHDVVYDSHKTDNEKASALQAIEVMRRAKITCVTEASMHTLIAATLHQDDPQSSDAKLMADIDLAIFGHKASAFDAYEKAIRQEYAWVDDAGFNTERSKMINRLLHQPHLYHTAMFRGRYETTARANLQRSLAKMSG